jgi:hypothetical protein
MEAEMKKVVLLWSVLAWVCIASATIIHVPGDYIYIQQAVNHAQPGDTVLVAPGIYMEFILMQEGVTLLGSGWRNTVIDANAAYNVITAPYGVLNYVIEGFELRNSQQGPYTPGNVGVHINPNSSTGTRIVRNCWIHHCGHGIQVWNDFGGTTIIEGNIISDNLYDGFYPYLGTVYLRNNTIVNNGRDGYNDWSGGGAIYIENNIIAQNGRYGIYKHQNTPVFISYNDVWNNAEGAYYQGFSGPAQPFIPQPGTGEIAADPLFTGQNLGFYITWWNFPAPDSSRSPCIDAGNPASPFDPDGTIRDMGALFFDQREFDVEITLVPLGTWVIPPEGGTLQYDTQIYNAEAQAADFDVWVMVTLPGGAQFGPVLGPIHLTLPAGAQITRSRSQAVPASAPPGIYSYQAMTGSFPTHSWDIASVPFTKTGDGDGCFSPDEWLCAERESNPEIRAQDAPATPSTAADLTICPNPFNPATTVRFVLPQAGVVKLEILDVSGRKVAVPVDGRQEAGRHEVAFDGARLPSGVYFAKLSWEGNATVRKLVLMK